MKDYEQGRRKIKAIQGLSRLTFIKLMFANAAFDIVYNFVTLQQVKQKDK